MPAARPPSRTCVVFAFSMRVPTPSAPLDPAISISGNTDAGVVIKGADAVNNLIRGNMIGTNATGEKELPNQSDGVQLGIERAKQYHRRRTRRATQHHLRQRPRRHPSRRLAAVSDRGQCHPWKLYRNQSTGRFTCPQPAQRRTPGGVCGNNTIGGTVVNAGNVISGNAVQGVAIVGQNAKMNHLVGNFIGTDPTGKRRVRNEEAGVLIDGAPAKRGRTGWDR